MDSGSTDGTLDIVADFPNVETTQRSFDSFADQCNFGLSHVQTEWVLSLDADYELSDDLVSELRTLNEEAGVAGYRVPFVYRIHGRSLRGTLYPPRTVLYRVQGAQYVNEGHGHRVSVVGEVKPLRNVIYHDDRKPLSRWLASQQNYARLEASYLLSAETGRLSRSDRMRRTGWIAPVFALPYALIVKGCLLDGRAGWYYALQRLAAEVMIDQELLD